MEFVVRMNPQLLLKLSIMVAVVVVSFLYNALMSLQTVEESLMEMNFRISPSAFFQGAVL